MASIGEAEVGGRAMAWPVSARPGRRGAAGRREPLEPRRERALVRAAQRGDDAAVEALFRAHWPACRRAAWLITRDAAAAEDIAQEAFLAALAALHRFDRRRPLGPWLRTIVARRAIDQLRARAARREVDAAAAEHAPAPPAPAPLRPSDDVLAAVAALPDEQRAVVVLRHLLDLTPSEVAEVLGLPVGTVNSRLRRGLDALRAPLAGALIAAGLAILAALPAQRGAVAGWVRAAVRVVAPAPPALRGTHLPGGGRILGTGPGGAVIIGGGRAPLRLAPAAAEASWSAHGRFVALARGSVLQTVDGAGRARWAVAAPARVRHPRWDPADGFRVAYLSAGLLRIVNGDGSGDRPVAPAAGAAPAWRPRPPGAGAPRELAFADRAGRVSAIDADSGVRRWRTPAGARVAALSWSADGARLLAVTARATVVLSATGRVLQRTAAPRGARNLAGAFAPSGRRYALLRRERSGATRVLLAPARTLLAVDAPLRGLAWSPDGRRLATGAPGAGSWLLLHPGPRRTTVRSVADGRAGVVQGWAP